MDRRNQCSGYERKELKHSTVMSRYQNRSTVLETRFPATRSVQTSSQFSRLRVLLKTSHGLPGSLCPNRGASPARSQNSGLVQTSRSNPMYSRSDSVHSPSWMRRRRTRYGFVSACLDWQEEIGTTHVHVFELYCLFRVSHEEPNENCSDKIECSKRSKQDQMLVVLVRIAESVLVLWYCHGQSTCKTEIDGNRQGHPDFAILLWEDL